MSSKLVVIHLSGPDKPGVTNGLLNTVYASQCNLKDFGQSVIHGHLHLSALVELNKNSRFIESTLFFASEHGLKLEAQPLANENKNIPQRGKDLPTLCVSLVGNLSDANALNLCTKELSKLDLNIVEIKTLSKDTLHGVEFIVSYKNDIEIKAIKQKLYKEIHPLGVDIAIQKNDWFRFAKRIVCLDVDSTFMNIEAIDELAGLVDKRKQVTEITDKAMNGLIDFDSALKMRVQLLKGIPLEIAKKHLQTAICSPGVEEFVTKLKRLGFKIGLVSGGFDFFVDEISKKFDLDFAFSNKLEVDSHNCFTGNINGKIINAQEKRNCLQQTCEHYQLQPEHVVAIGDGANDALMLNFAGLGVAYRAKPILKTHAHMALDHARFDDLFYLMGCANI